MLGMEGDRPRTRSCKQKPLGQLINVQSDMHVSVPQAIRPLLFKPQQLDVEDPQGDRHSPTKYTRSSGESHF